MAAVDFFLKLDGIDGEATARGHEKWIEIQSFSWGVTNTTTIGSGGAGTGKAAPADFTLQLPFSIASPTLFKKAVSGQFISEGTLSLSKAGKGQTSDFLKWKMSDILISSYQVEGAGDGPYDQISLNFTKIEVSYTQQNLDGSAGTTLSEGWDFQKNVGF